MLSINTQKNILIAVLLLLGATQVSSVPVIGGLGAMVIGLMGMTLFGPVTLGVVAAAVAAWLAWLIGQRKL